MAIYQNSLMGMFLFDDSISVYHFDLVTSKIKNHRILDFDKLKKKVFVHIQIISLANI